MISAEYVLQQPQYCNSFIFVPPVVKTTINTIRWGYPGSNWDLHVPNVQFYHYTITPYSPVQIRTEVARLKT